MPPRRAAGPLRAAAGSSNPADGAEESKADENARDTGFRERQEAMPKRKTWRILWSCWLLAVGLGAAPGCLSCCHPVAPPGPEVAEPCQALPHPCRRQVHIFMLNGIDPLCCSNFKGLRQYLHTLGFTKTYYGDCYDAPWIAHKIRKIHREEPDVRFVLIGFDLGANAACWTAQTVAEAGVPIDLLVYLDGCCLSSGPGNRPGNVAQVLNVVAGCGKCLVGAEQIDVSAWHNGTPTHPEPRCALARALAEVAAQVPLLPQPEPCPLLGPLPGPPGTPEAAPPAEEMAPTPRPVPPQETTERDEWDFLKPSEQLRPLREGPRSSAPVQVGP